MNDGELVVSGSLSGSTVSVASGATLNLTGTITTPAALTVNGTMTGTGFVTGASGEIQIGGTGTVAPGTGVGNAGTLAASTLTTLNGATLQLELVSDTLYDSIATANPINLASGENTTLSLSLIGGYVPGNDGKLFFILTNSGAGAATTGLFAGTTTQTVAGYESLGSVPTITAGGQLFAISYGADAEGSPAFTGGNDVALMAVPEPNAMAMLAGSLGLALGLQRFRRRRTA